MYKGTCIFLSFVSLCPLCTVLKRNLLAMRISCGRTIHIVVVALIQCITFNCTLHGAMSRGVLCTSRRYVMRSIMNFTALCHAEYYALHGAMSRGMLHSSRRYVTRSTVHFTALCHAEYYALNGATSRGVLCTSRRHVTRSTMHFHGAMSRGVLCTSRRYVTRSTMHFTAL